MVKVAISRATGYEILQVRRGVCRGLELLGGIEDIVKPGDHVFVKINHLPPPSPPEKAIITHPVFTQAVLECLLEVTPHLIVGDDIRADSGQGFVISGYSEVCRRLGVRLVNLPELGFTKVLCQGKVLKETYLARAVLEADVVVNLPKLKTHSLTLLTGAVKNFYGVIPAGLRTQYHGYYPRLEEFSQLLVDIFSQCRPSLTVMDGIVAMEGDGPANGTPRELGLVLASRDAVAVDAVASRITGIDPWAVATTRLAHAQGLGVGDPAEIEVVGEPLEEVAVVDFALPSSVPARIVDRLPRRVAAFFTRQLTPGPQVTQDRCVGCGVCESVCPVAAARLAGGKAHIDQGRCIRCMCCHEACRYGAIELRRGPIGQIFHALEGLARHT